MPETSDALDAVRAVHAALFGLVEASAVLARALGVRALFNIDPRRIPPGFPSGPRLAAEIRRRGSVAFHCLHLSGNSFGPDRVTAADAAVDFVVRATHLLRRNQPTAPQVFRLACVALVTEQQAIFLDRPCSVVGLHTFRGLTRWPDHVAWTASVDQWALSLLPGFSRDVDAGQVRVNVRPTQIIEQLPSLRAAFNAPPGFIVSAIDAVISRIAPLAATSAEPSDADREFVRGAVVGAAHDTLPLNLEGAPVIPAGDSPTPWEAMRYLTELRRACIRREAEGRAAAEPIADAQSIAKAAAATTAAGPEQSAMGPPQNLRDAIVHALATSEVPLRTHEQIASATGLYTNNSRFRDTMAMLGDEGIITKRDGVYVLLRKSPTT